MTGVHDVPHVRRKHGYGEAVCLLGGVSPAMKTLDTILGTATLGFWDLIDAKGQFIAIGNDLLGRWSDWRAERVWKSRTERLQAAHTVLVVTAFFKAVDELKLDLHLTRRDQDRLSGVSSEDGLGHFSSPCCPSPQVPFEENLRLIRDYYLELHGRTWRLIQGLAVWEKLPEEKRDLVKAQTGTLVETAIDRYRDDYRRLAVDVPEFAFWAGMTDHQATRAGLAELERMLRGVTSGQVLPAELESLVSLHRAALRRRVAELDEAPAGIELPFIEDAYVTPRFRLGVINRSDNPSVEAWWKDREVQPDLPVFLSGFLTNPLASQVPLIVLGQPGAGKSLLTEVLAARLSDDFPPVRVSLREVAANADIQEQIEQAIYKLSGERLQWTAFSRSAEGALPIVLLDGFDELLQATGVHQSDYLTRVARFQQRERDAGRPVAIIVTSRTAVADRTDYPEGTVAIRLEPFDESQIRQWLDTWNTENRAYFARGEPAPFTADVALTQPRLAEQPLLLLMLALFDADGNALRKNLNTLSQADLYERLMRRFAERELRKSYPNDQVQHQVERELLHLSVVAYAMFNRGRLWATREEVDEDLAALNLAEKRQPSFLTPLSSGDRAFGRFFFIHRAKAKRDRDVLHTYEFLHATFGEFLIARLIVSLLAEMAPVHASALHLTRVDDGLLRSLLSHAMLSARTAVVLFVCELAANAPGFENRRWLQLVRGISKELDTRDDSSFVKYRPTAAGPPRRYAYYSANLLVIALALSPALDAAEMLPVPDGDVMGAWQSHALLWRSQCRREEWHSLLSMVEVTYRDTDTAQPVIHLLWEPLQNRTSRALDLVRPHYLDAGGQSTALLREQYHFCRLTDETLLLHALEPLLAADLARLVTECRRVVGGAAEKRLTSLLHDMLTAVSLPPGLGEPAQRSRTYASIAEGIPQPDKEITRLSAKAIAGDLVLIGPEGAAAIITSTVRFAPRTETFMRAIADLIGVTDRVIWP